MIALRLEAVLVGDVVESDDLAIRCSPCDRSLDGDFFGIRSQVVDNCGFLAGDTITGLVTEKVQETFSLTEPLALRIQIVLQRFQLFFHNFNPQTIYEQLNFFVLWTLTRSCIRQFRCCRSRTSESVRWQSHRCWHELVVGVIGRRPRRWRYRERKRPRISFCFGFCLSHLRCFGTLVKNWLIKTSRGDFIYRPLSSMDLFGGSQLWAHSVSVTVCSNVICLDQILQHRQKKKLKSHKNILKHIIFSLVAAVDLHIFEVYFKENINIVDYFRNLKKSVANDAKKLS